MAGNYHHRRPPPPRAGVPAYVYAPAIAATGTLGYCYYQCIDEAPYTGRRRVIATSPRYERTMGDREHENLVRKFRGDILPPHHRASATVRRVGDRIASAAEEFADRHVPPHYEVGDGRPYTYTVVRSDEANAFVLPGNHVFVLTGLFRYARDEDDLAAVIGHEVAHNLARHAGERLTGGLAVSVLARLTLLIDPSGVLYALFLPGAALLHALPNSREAEMEADRIGIRLAAAACYDPRAAKRVFSAMKNDAGGGGGRGGSSPPEFMSTHPSYDTRLTKFDDWMPDALSVFNADGGARCRRVRREMEEARRRAAEAAARR